MSAKNAVVTVGELEVQLLVATPVHVCAMKELHEIVYKSRVDEQRLATDLSVAYGVVATRNDTVLGYLYRRRIAPEVLGDGELVVDRTFRGQGLGSAIVRYFDATLPEQWMFSIVINSDFYGSLEEKVSTGAFWQRHGYELLGDSSHTRVL